VKHWVPVVVASAVGLLVLLGYLFPGVAALKRCREALTEWAVIVTAFAFVLGLLNIVRVHGGRVVRWKRGGGHSLLLLVAALAGCVPALLLEPSSLVNQKLIDAIIGPLGASLAGLVVFTLGLAAFRLLRVRRSVEAVVFILVVMVALLGSVPIVGLGWLAELRSWIVSVPAMAGTRGLLLGVALGTIITALRVILAFDRPHSEF
jgi:hypothetical protein